MTYVKNNVIQSITSESCGDTYCLITDATYMKRLILHNSVIHTYAPYILYIVQYTFYEN